MGARGGGSCKLAEGTAADNSPILGPDNFNGAVAVAVQPRHVPSCPAVTVWLARLSGEVEESRRGVDCECARCSSFCLLSLLTATVELPAPGARGYGGPGSGNALKDRY